MTKELKEIDEAFEYAIGAIYLNKNPKLLTNGDIRMMLEEAWAMVGQVDRSLEFYKQRCDNLQKIQSKMRDPERKWVCDILANGYTWGQGAEPMPQSAQSQKAEKSGPSG